MSFSIPALKGYFGGKGGSGTYQQIINIIPPHKILCVPFLGNCGIVRNIKPPWLVKGNDIDPFVVDAWKSGIKHKQDILIVNMDWKDFFTKSECHDDYSIFIYLDPPYPHDSRKSNHRYTFELSDNDHIDLLGRAKEYHNAKIAISTYDNPIYKEHLKGWNKISFQSQTRNGVAIETVYFNYEPPTELHDYSYLGDNYKQREQYQLKKKHLVAKFERMTPLEQNYYANALKSEFKTLF